MVEIRQNFCGKCGAPLLEGSEQFCGNCGAPLRLDALAEQANLGGQTSVPVGPDPSSAAEKPGDDGTQESTSKTRSDRVEPQVGDAESRTLRGWLIQHEIARVIGFRRTSHIDGGVLGLKGRVVVLMFGGNSPPPHVLTILASVPFFLVGVYGTLYY